ncbi:MAG: hypothetical protein WBI40_03315 [Methylococcaceae bacterium]
MKRLTKNRIDIMRCLSGEHYDCGLPPFSVGTIHYMLYFYEYDSDGNGHMANISKERRKTQHNQIRRTLEELAMEGVVVMSRELNDVHRDLLPYWEKKYQIAEMVEANYLEQEIKDIEFRISRINGVQMFGAVFDARGLTKSDKKELTAKVKRLIQRTHPDKISGKEHHFIKMKKYLDVLRETPTK